MKKTVHKSDHGRDYRGIPIHAAIGIHESVSRAMQALLPTKKIKVLEVGAGSGALTSRLIDEGYEVIPLDLDGSTWKLPHIDLIEGDLNASSWTQLVKDKGFNCILAVEIIEHLENPKKFIKEAYEILPAGGFLIVTTPNIFCADSIQQAIRNQSLFGFDFNQCYTTGHISILPSWLLKSFGMDVGFKVLDIRTIGVMDKKTIKKFIIRILAKLIDFIRKNEENKEGDGIVTMIIYLKHK